MYYVYILECQDGTLYTGITTDVQRRFQEHRLGKGGAYTKARGAKKLVYLEKCQNRSSALKREAEIKNFSREKKLALAKMVKPSPLLFAS